jgi:putative ATP-binding cassette transporter
MGTAKSHSWAGVYAVLLQKSYLPVDTLRYVLSYPALPSAFTDAAIREVLAACGLPHLTDRLDASQHWAQQLPGEQTHWVCRALLQQPTWLFLDEQRQRSTPRAKRGSTGC